MKHLLLLVLLAAAATAAVVSNDVPGMVEVSNVADGDEVANVTRSDQPEWLFFRTGQVLMLVDEQVWLPAVTEVEQAAEATQSDLYVGTIGPSDRLLASTALFKQPAARVVHIQDVYIDVGSSVKITAMHAQDMNSNNEGSTVTILGVNPVGSNRFTIRLQSARGRGYRYNVHVYGN